MTFNKVLISYEIIRRKIYASYEILCFEMLYLWLGKFKSQIKQVKCKTDRGYICIHTIALDQKPRYVTIVLNNYLFT